MKVLCGMVHSVKIIKHLNNFKCLVTQCQSCWPYIWWRHTYLDDHGGGLETGWWLTLTLKTRNMSGWVMTSHLPSQPGICLETNGWWTLTVERPGICLEMGRWWCHTYLWNRNMSGVMGDDVTLTLTTRNMSGNRAQPSIFRVMMSHLPWIPDVITGIFK